MRSAAEWLDEYGVSHRHPANKALHWICVPVIVWCVLGFLWCIPTPAALDAERPFANWAILALVATLLYYALLSVPLALGALPALLVMGWSVAEVARRSPAPLWIICAVLFVLAWIGQFIGHGIEGKRPSFFRDVQFLLVGPLWLVADAYRRLGIHIRVQA